LVLIDDPEKTVIEPLIKQKSALKTLYDFDLMQNSGHLKGFLVNDTNLENAVVHAISNLADCDLFKKKYNLTDDRKCLLFAVGDGNHSLATAKSVWEKLKPTVGMHHPARYALVEIENVHDAGLEFEPIHRVLFGVKQDIKQGLKAYFGDSVSFETISNRSDLQKRIAVLQSDCQSIGLISPAGYELVCIRNPRNNLAVGSLQNFLDQWLKSGGADNIDYVHGEEIVFKIGSQPGHIGFIVPGMPKADLFRSVIFDGSLPRKAFSMGEAREKRFYMECRYLS
ncbi:MAG: DUF1015 domain-containing protein, partial [Anaerolineae bacterium]|nr:DUF1015 domain-containing protein [Anaerolineae bacterium]